MIDPLYVPGNNAVASTFTLRTVGVMPCEGLTDSQAPPEAEAVKLIEGPELVTEMFCGPGLALPASWIKSNDAADVLIVVSRTVKETPMVCGLLLTGESILMLPLYTPAARPTGFTDTVRVLGVDPLRGVIDSQAPPEMVAVNGTGELVLLTKRVCGVGLVPPI